MSENNKVEIYFKVAYTENFCHCYIDPSFLVSELYEHMCPIIQRNFGIKNFELVTNGQKLPNNIPAEEGNPLVLYNSCIRDIFRDNITNTYFYIRPLNNNMDNIYQQLQIDLEETQRIRMHHDIQQQDTIKTLNNELEETHRKSIQIHDIMNCSLSVEEIEQLKTPPICIICVEKERNIMFSPCNHISCCSSCSTNLMNCPICRTDITKKIIAYIS